MTHIGPQLPAELAQKMQRAGSDSSDDDSASHVSTGPPEISKSPSNDDVYGPALPPDLLPPPSSTDKISNDQEVPAPTKEVSGSSGSKKAGSRNFSDSEDDHGPTVGPCLPTDDPEKEFEKNFITFKQKEYHNAAIAQTSQKREEWMTSLPSKLKTYGLGARQFSKMNVDEKDDGSEWTKDPLNPHKSDNKEKEGAKKSSHSHHGKSGFHAKRDKVLEKQVEKFNEEKQRKESLIDLHHKKRKLETSKEDEKTSKRSKSKERRPFDREKDLKIVDPAKMSHKAMVQKAAQLSSRFSHSTQQKFL